MKNMNMNEYKKIYIVKNIYIILSFIIILSFKNIV